MWYKFEGRLPIKIMKMTKMTNGAKMTNFILVVVLVVAAKAP